jgi:hypothetical protein
MALRYELRNPTATVLAGWVSGKLVELGFGSAGLGGDNCWGYNHSNEGEGDQEVMHGVVSLV